MTKRQAKQIKKMQESVYRQICQLWCNGKNCVTYWGMVSEPLPISDLLTIQFDSESSAQPTRFLVKFWFAAEPIWVNEIIFE